MPPNTASFGGVGDLLRDAAGQSGAQRKERGVEAAGRHGNHRRAMPQRLADQMIQCVLFGGDGRAGLVEAQHRFAVPMLEV